MRVITTAEPPQSHVAVVGLGYVGLTLSVALALRGIKVFGIERRPEVVEATNKGIPHFSEVGLADAMRSVVESGMLVASETLDAVPQCQYYIITVGTPLRDGTHEPRLDMIEAASNQVAEHFQAGATVILRSTVLVDTTRKVVKPILDRKNLPYHLAMCPERTLEGNALKELAELPQIIGGIDTQSFDTANALFSLLTKTTVRVDSPETAEMIKLVDNTFRDVRFAFANEVARACVAVGINAHDVIRLGKLGYPRTNVALPGPVGGPCLEKDPHILLRSLQNYGVDLEITRASRLVNERQPAETVASILRIAAERKKSHPLTVAVLGLAFKGVPETDDLRGSMTLKIIDELRKTDAIGQLRVFDPVILGNMPEEISAIATVHTSMKEAVANVDIVIIANNHPCFARHSIDEYVGGLNENGFIYDYWNNLESEPVNKRRNVYFTVGNNSF